MLLFSEKKNRKTTTMGFLHSFRKKFWLKLIFGLILVAIIYSFFHSDRPAEETATVTRGEIKDQVVASGQIIPAHVAQVKSQIAGVAGEIYVNEGDVVSKNQVLMTVAPNATPEEYNDALAQVKQDQAKIMDSQAEYLRSKKLLAKHFTSLSEFDAKKSAYLADAEKLKQDQVKLNLLKTGTAQIAGKKVVNQIRSPIDGVILSRKVELGDTITPITLAQAGTVLFVIANMHDLQFQGQVSQIDVGKLKPNMLADISIASLPNLKLSGKILRISLITADQNDQSPNSQNADLFKQSNKIQNGYTVTIAGFQVPQNTLLRAGYQATASMTVQQVRHALTLPESAIYYEGDQAYVLLAGVKGKAQKRQVTLGVTDGIKVQVISGLKENDKILLNAGQANGEG
jgi:HlyD family secretion protein